MNLWFGTNYLDYSWFN